MCTGPSFAQATPTTSNLIKHRSRLHPLLWREQIKQHLASQTNDIAGFRNQTLPPITKLNGVTSSTAQLTGYPFATFNFVLGGRVGLFVCAPASLHSSRGRPCAQRRGKSTSLCSELALKHVRTRSRFHTRLRKAQKCCLICSLYRLKSWFLEGLLQESEAFGGSGFVRPAFKHDHFRNDRRHMTNTSGAKKTSMSNRSPNPRKSDLLRLVCSRACALRWRVQPFEQELGE